MGFRISSIAPIGSLLKGPPKARERKGRPKRDAAPKHLAAIRRCPCLSCDADPAGEAAHVRMTVAGKPITGTGAKPDDRWTVPLCSECHTRHGTAQHRVGEVEFWRALGLDPLAIAAELYATSPDIGAMRAVAFKHREGRK